MTPHAAFYTNAGGAPVSRFRPLLVADADEVLLGFAAGFSRFLEARGLHLDLVSYRLHGNVRRNDDRTALLDIEVSVLLDEFREDLDWLEPISGAREVLTGLAPRLDVVVLSNVTAAQAPARLRNLERLGLPYPLVINAGLKGEAVKALSRRAGRPVFFVDDIPQHHQSVAQAAPHVHRIHFIGDDRLKPLLPPAEHAHISADNWAEIGAFVGARLDESGF